jgi:ribose transport system substrate-binding protein
MPDPSCALKYHPVWRYDVKPQPTRRFGSFHFLAARVFQADLKRRGSTYRGATQVNFIKSWSVIGLIAVLLALPFLASCNKDKDKTADTSASSGDNANLKLAFVTNNASEFWKIASAGVHKYEKETGVQVDIKLPSTGKVDEQNRILDNLSSQGYNAIAVSVIAPADQIDEMNRLAKTTKLITFDSDCAKSDRLLYIGTNNFEAGKTLGGKIVTMLPNGGKMAVFVGSLSADNAAQRLAGIEDAIKGHNIEIVAKKEDATDRAKARSNVEDVINAYPDLNLVTGLWSYNGPAIALAIESTGKKGKVLAAVFDEEPGTLDGIKAGTIQVTCVQKPFQFGYLSAKWMNELAKPGSTVKIPEGGVIDTGVDLIDSTNVDAFSKKLAELKAGA